MSAFRDLFTHCLPFLGRSSDATEAEEVVPQPSVAQQRKITAHAPGPKRSGFLQALCSIPDKISHFFQSVVSCCFRRSPSMKPENAGKPKSRSESNQQAFESRHSDDANRLADDECFARELQEVELRAALEAVDDDSPPPSPSAPVQSWKSTTLAPQEGSSFPFAELTPTAPPRSWNSFQLPPEDEVSAPPIQRARTEPPAPAPVPPSPAPAPQEAPTAKSDTKLWFDEAHELEDSEEEPDDELEPGDRRVVEVIGFATALKWLSDGKKLEHYMVEGKIDLGRTADGQITEQAQRDLHAVSELAFHGADVSMIQLQGRIDIEQATPKWLEEVGRAGAGLAQVQLTGTVINRDQLSRAVELCTVGASVADLHVAMKLLVATTTLAHANDLIAAQFLRASGADISGAQLTGPIADVYGLHNAYELCSGPGAAGVVHMVIQPELRDPSGTVSPEEVQRQVSHLVSLGAELLTGEDLLA